MHLQQDEINSGAYDTDPGDYLMQGEPMRRLSETSMSDVSAT